MEKYKLFKKKVEYWREKLGLSNFEIFVLKFKSDKNRAEWYVDYSAHMITIYVDKRWVKKASKKEIDLVAFHEVYECQLGKFIKESRRFLNDNYVDEMIHDITKRAENFIYPELKS